LSLIEKNSIGKILSVHADFGFYLAFNAKSRLYDKSLGGGSLLDVGIYPIYLSLLLLGKPSKIQAKAVFGQSGVDESCAMIFEYADEQQMAVLHSSVKAKTATEAFIYGEKGKIHLHGRFHEPNIGITLEVHGEEPVFYPFEWDCIGYAYEAKEVMCCVRTGKKESAAMSHAFSLDLISILDEVQNVTNIKYNI
jgi:predicted dehydrogenase